MALVPGSMRSILLPLAAAATLLAGAPPAAAAADADTRSCGFVAFAPNSDFGAFLIRARDTSCATARRVARASRREHRGPSGRAGRTVRWEAEGFVCRGVERDEGLSQVRYRCRRGGALVAFSRS